MDASVYSRPNKPKTTIVHSRRDSAPTVEPLDIPEVVELDKSSECHVTPVSVAERMADYLELSDHLTILEPSAGTGHLIDAVLEYNYCNVSVTAIERHYKLCDLLCSKYAENSQVNIVQDCFLEHAKTCSSTFHRVIINPPFKLIKRHIKAAIDLLVPGGIMVALVPLSFEHPEAELLEELEAGTFSAAAVRTKLVRIEKN